MDKLLVIIVIAGVCFVKWKFFSGDKDPFNKH